MNKSLLTVSLLIVAVLMLSQREGTRRSAAQEIKDPHQMMNLLWLGKDNSIQTEKEIILKSFNFQTQG